MDNETLPKSTPENPNFEPDATSQHETQLTASFNKMASELLEESIEKLNIEIAERKQAEKRVKKQNKFLNGILESISHPLCVIDIESHKILLANHAMYEGNLAQNVTCYQLNHHMQKPCDRKSHECPLQIVKETGKQTVVEHIHFNVNGVPRHFEVHVYPLFDDNGRVESVIEYSLDITERKEAEQKLKNINQELKHFVYIASHDLREPLRKITSFGSLLKQSLAEKISDDDDKENLDFMIDGASRMTKMVEGLLTYSRVSTKQQSSEAIDVNEIINQLRELELAILLEEKHVTVNIPQALPPVEIDPVQIRQLFQNLIANGIKYQKPDVAPIITITSKSAADGMVRIEVTDNGIGIKPEYQQAVFSMFKRLHSRTEYEGTGIGLTVCKKIVEQYNGDIGVESKYGEGSTFWFTLPAARVSPTAVLQS